MGRSQRNDLILAQVIRSPGPGTYGLLKSKSIGYMEGYETKLK